MLLGYWLLLTALGLYYSSLFTIIWTTPLFVGLILEYTQMIEEKQLLRWFGKDYEKYQKKVPLIIPRFRKKKKKS